MIKEYTEGTIYTLKSTAVNCGPVTRNGKVRNVVHSDGEAVKAGDLVAGRSYYVDWYSDDAVTLVKVAAV